MKKGKFLLMAAMLISAGSAVAGNDGEVIDLLPDGVTANINPERKQDKQKNLVVAGTKEKGYKAFFAASDAEHGEELWVTDGTKAGTHMVKDIVAGTGSSNPSYIGRFNDKVVFSAYTNGEGQETWISDGTEAGTFMLADTYAIGDGDPKAFTQIDETHVVFAAVDDESAEYDPDRGAQHWLWITDGTEAGTKRVAKCDMRHPGQDNTTPYTSYVRVGRRMFFKADNIDGTTGEELWVTDGTEAGTYEVMDINWEKYGEGQKGYEEGWTRNCGLDNLVNYENKGVFFQAWTPDFGGEPWFSDGTKAAAPNGKDGEGDEHTYMIKDTRPGKDANGIGYHAGTFGISQEAYKDRIYWRGYDSVGGYEIGSSNMQKGDYHYMDIWTEEPSVDHQSFSDPGAVFDGVYIFCAAHGFDANLADNYGGELWCTDGDKVWLQYDLCPGNGCDWAKELTVAGGSLYWMNENNDVAGGFGTGLYRLDAKDGVPVVCTHIVPTGDFVNSLRNLGGQIVFGSDATKHVYTYKYTKQGWDGVSDMGYMDPDFGTATDIQNVNAKNTINTKVNVFTIDGVQVRSNVSSANATDGLQKGVYVVGTKKVVIR